MQEWWAYSPSDFLLFSPRTYYRMVGHYNEALWPAQLLTVGLGAGILALLRRPIARQGEIVSIILAVLWALVSWAFLWKRYAAINWAATYVVPLFAIEGLLMVWIGVVRGRLSLHLRRDAARMLGLAVFILSLAFYPMLAPLAGRPWEQAEIFGLAPDPTVMATGGLLLLAEGPPRWELLVVPILWCLGSGVTLWAMGSPEALILLPAGLLVIVAAIWSQRNWKTQAIRSSQTSGMGIS